MRLNKAPKTSTERSREYRARKRLYKQQSEQQQKLDSIEKALTKENQSAGPSERRLNDTSTSTERTIEMRLTKDLKTSTERSREYRARKRLYKQQSEQQQKLDSIEKALTKENQSAGPSERRLNDTSTSTERTIEMRLTKDRKTSTERSREYRARKRLYKQQSEQQQKLDSIEKALTKENQSAGPSERRLNDTSTSTERTIEMRLTKELKTSTERSREYRARKRLYKQQSEQQQKLDSIEKALTKENQSAGPSERRLNDTSTSTERTIEMRLTKDRKTSTERSREYRARKRLYKQQSEQQQKLDSIEKALTKENQSAGPSERRLNDTSTSTERTIEMRLTKDRKTSTERSREYRARKRLYKQQSEQQQKLDSIEKALTKENQSAGPSERRLNDTSTSTERTIEMRLTKDRKTSTERSREYRARKRLYKQQSEQQQKLDSIEKALTKENQSAGPSERRLNDTSTSRERTRGALTKERNQKNSDKHREEISQRKRDNRLNQQNLQPIASCSDVHSIQPIQHDEVSSKQVGKKNALKKQYDRIYQERHGEVINQRRRERGQRQQNVQRIATASNVYNIDAIQQITEAIPDHQPSANCSHVNIIQEITQNVNRGSQKHNTQYLKERQNIYFTHGRDQIHVNEAQNSNTYSNYQLHKVAHKHFNDNFKNNEFGQACSICDRLWFQKDLKKPSLPHENIINTITNIQDMTTVKICSTCKSALDKNNIPTFAVYNGFQYPEIPEHLPTLDFVTERLLSPRIPFMQIRRLRHVHGQFGIYGQIINVPVTVDTMIQSLPRNINDEHCVYVHIKKQIIHKTSFVHGLVKIKSIKMWLQHLINTPLYEHYKITVDESFFNQEIPQITQENIDDFSENIDIEESLTAQQQTLLWNEDKYLRIAPGQHNIPQSLLFDEHAEELSFPSIYIGQFRTFRDEVRVTPFMMASSELRRRDRRGVHPYHLLYMAVKIMRLRVRDCLVIAFKHIGTDTNITKEQVQSEEYINNCIDSNLAFLRSIPNSVWYWTERKRDLFAMIRQIGKPTAFMTLSANEIGWLDLLKLLHTLAQGSTDTEEFIASELSFIEKSSLINNDAVTCAIYFNKMVNVIMTILQSKKFSPFGKYRVNNYFKRIEFQHRGSPHAHILLWLDNAPKDILGQDQEQAIEMIDSLISVSASEASGNIKLITHKHTFTCYKKVIANSLQKCRFDAPFMPCKFTMILIPMEKTDPRYKEYSKRYAEIRMNLESHDYSSIDDYYESNNIRSDEEYRDILRSGIIRPRIFYKRHPSEKWHNTFNPFVFNILKSNMDFQIITEEYSCAAYVVEYVNKTNRGISNLQRKIIEVMNEHPEFDVVEITRKMSVDMLNSVEMSSEEAAWYLLREPMSKSSVVVQYINTVWPIERQRIKKTQKQISELHDDSTDIWKEDWYEKYQKRPEELENVSLAQFVSKYTHNNNGVYVERKQPRIIRYRNYDMAHDYNEYRREMVTLHLPFRNEDTEILADMKFTTIYDENENSILEKRKEFESDIDIQKTIDICRQLCRQDEQFNEDVSEIPEIATRFPEPNPFQELYRNPNAAVNEDLRIATLKNLGAIAKRRENIMSLDQFCELMRSANEKQKDLLLHVINHILSAEKSPLQVFFTGPAGCGKTYVIKLIMEIYNRLSDNDGFCNAYITCASTGKAAVAINGTTIHTALKISLSKLLPLSMETAQQYRCLFKYVKVLIIDEISMIGAELLNQIDSRLKQITGNFDSNFGGLDIILIGDLRQLPPVRATPIYKQPKQRMIGPLLWRGLKFYELTQVMRQTNVMFASILTKIGNGSILDGDELAIIESRFLTKEEVAQRCPNGVRLFHENASVNEYNLSILQQAQNKLVSIAIDILNGCTNHEQEAFVRQKLHKMPVIDTGGLPYEIIFVIGKPYIITTNIDVTDGLANGAVGTLVHIEQNEENEITRVWLIFADKRTGTAAKKKAAAFVVEHDIDKRAVPITRRTSNVSLNNNKTIVGKRNHFPLIPGCAMTIHKSQGGTYDEIVYEYNKTHSIQLVYVALSRVTSIEGLFICTRNDDLRFYHGRRCDTSVLSLKEEFQRLSLNRLTTLQAVITDFITSRQGLTIFTLNCQSLRKHAPDIQDSICKKSNFLLLSETWLPDEEDVQLPNFDCVVKFKRNNVRAAGVAIYHNTNSSLTVQHVKEINVNQAAIADLCASHIIMDDGRELLIAVVYISPNQTIKDIISFLHQQLLPYSYSGSRILQEHLYELPLILAGDFNVNFTTNESILLITFLQEEFQLRINNDPKESTTRYGTTIDAVFSRYLDNIMSKTFVTYFSYHRPIVTTVL